PPAGYQPILLPGESISKYRDRGPASVVHQREENFGAIESRRADSRREDTHAELSEKFPQDEPLFAQANDSAVNLNNVSATADRVFNTQSHSETHDRRASVYEEHVPLSATLQQEAGSADW